MDLKKQQMEVMHSMCQSELNTLQKNLQIFVQESEHLQKVLKQVILKGNGIFGLVSFDRYMSQVVTVFNMARRFNMHFQINSLQQTVINGSPRIECLTEDGISQACILNDFIEINSAIFENRSVCQRDIITSRVKPEIEDSSPQLKNGNKDSFDENVNKRKSLASNNALIKYEENKGLESFHIQGENIEQLINALLPTKCLDLIQINCELEAYIVNVNHYKNLEFFICQMEDYKTLFHLSRFANFNQIPLSTLPLNDIFVVLEKRNDFSRDYLSRAVKVPYKHESDIPKEETVYLIDFGEKLSLTDICKAYEAPQHYKEIPPLAVKCKLDGIENTFLKSIVSSQEKCEQFLQKNEFEKVTVRVVEKKANVLHVMLLDFSRNFFDTVNTQNFRQKNPFLDDKICEEDYEQTALPIPFEFTSRPSTSTMSSLNISANVGDCIQIMVTHVVSPISFYGIIQNNFTEGASKVFSWDEHQICSSQKAILPPQTNDIVLSRYYKDDYYYRAKVIDVDQELDRYKVFYVDFGNTEIVPLCSLAKCSKEQLEDPLRAVLFHLSNLSLVTFYDEAMPSDTSYMNSRLKNALENVLVMILDQFLNVKIIEKENNEFYVSLLDEQYDSIPNMLLNMGVVKEL